MIQIKRVYENPEPRDGYRILVDRVWPRGISKAQAKVDWWPKEIAPSKDLRKWFGHDPAKWEYFKQYYKQELQERDDLLTQIKELEKQKGTIALLFAAKDTEHNNAVVLKEVLENLQ